MRRRSNHCCKHWAILQARACLSISLKTRSIKITTRYFDGVIAIIIYLSVDESVKDRSIGKALEQHVTEQAKKRKCERIQVHCLDWRAQEHEFYKQQGYVEYPKYYTKRLVYGE
jgi:GNAT superfamily N-acetyltransferase